MESCVRLSLCQFVIFFYLCIATRKVVCAGVLVVSCVSTVLLADTVCEVLDLFFVAFVLFEKQTAKLVLLCRNVIIIRGANVSYLLNKLCSSV